MITFSGPEYQPDGSIRVVPYSFEGSAKDGWEVKREGKEHLRLGPGYRPLRVSHCGVCSTDLARIHLPFRLPQIIGHEVVAVEDSGEPVVVEINASHAARGLGPPHRCSFCNSDLGTHCPERLVLGIHDLPGGFSPWILAPAGGVLPVPAGISPATAALVEPFAAALHAVRALDPIGGKRIAVLGPRRLGGLLISALAAWRVRSGSRYEILAVVRRPEMRSLAGALGADNVLDADRAREMHDIADVVVDTTGNPDALALAIQLATREVHVKSTTGLPTLGLLHLTELVVDEMTLVPYRDAELASTFLASPPLELAVLLGQIPAVIEESLRSRGFATIAGDDGAEIASKLARDPGVPLGGADLAVVTSLTAIDAAIRPQAGVERGLVRPRGTIAVLDVGQSRTGLLEGILGKGLRITTTRCGDFRPAIDLLSDPATDLGQRLGERMVTGRFPAVRLAEALAAAAAPRSVKVLVTHPGALL
jgi:threonine dehydrogenase-like Zn-dependent dehydrogenase